MEQVWNNNDGGKPNYSERNLSQCHFYPPYVPHRPAWDRTTDSVVLTATNHLSHGLVMEWRKFHNAELQIRNFHPTLLH